MSVCESVGADVGAGVVRVCGDRAEVVYRHLCLDCTHTVRCMQSWKEKKLFGANPKGLKHNNTGCVVHAEDSAFPQGNYIYIYATGHTILL